VAVRIFSRSCRRLAWVFLFWSAGISAFSRAAEPEELSDEEARQVQIAERFLDILMKNPRRGTALDRVYGHHVEFGTLDAFLEKLDQRLQDNTQDGAGWMLLGLIQSQRGADAQAAEALEQAETHRPTDPLASYYLAQSLLRIGESEAAVAAFERALARNPARADLLEISQQFGRVHQRAQRVEQALAVWQRLESQFPDDPRVLEQIAITLAEEGALAEALARYQRLADLVRDDYRRVTFKIQAAELTIRLGQRQQGLDQLETLLADLNPDGWLYRDVRRRIEEVFLKAADQDGLVKYYQQWLGKRPDDVEAMARLARFLASSARMPEAWEWMERALERAPSRGDLRRAFIDQLIDDQRIGEAIEQYRLLAESSPGNPDYLRDWGRLVLRDRTQDITDRRREASRIWRLILAERPDDALTAAQVADLFRQADMPDEAVELYQRAIDLAPGAAQYREYLGEFYHHQKQPDRAIETWEGIAAGSHRTAANVARLAEVYYGFGYLDRAIRAMDEACRLASRDFHLHLRAAEYQLRAERYETALQLTEAAGKLATIGDEREAVLARRIEVLQASQQLDEQTDRLAAAVRSNPAATAEDWQLVARYFEAARRWAEAIEAAEAALQREPKSLPALATAARVLEVAGDLGRAAELHRRLADADRRARGEHMMSVARLESQLGRIDQALQAARDLIVTAPGNTDHYEFYAQLCRQLGQADEGLQALRKAVRINPNQPHLIMALGSALADQLRTDEAIEIYWRAFDRSDDVDDKTSLILRLVPLYQQINQGDQLIERLERQRREEPQRRVMTICLAQAHHAAGDYGTARHELESLLSDDTRDTHLLHQLARLCQEAGDQEAVIAYQRQLVAIAPGHETELPLAGMLQQFGQRDEATEILVRLTAREDDPVRLLLSVDSLLSQGSFEAALRVVEPLLGQQRDDWELLYREGVALANLERTDEAAHRFQRLLALNLPHQTLGQQAAARWKEQQARARQQNLAIAAAQSPDRLPMLTNAAHTVRPAVGLGPDYDDPMVGGPGRGPMPRIWTPDSFAVARMAAYGWLLRFEREQQRSAADQATGQPDPPEPLAERLARRAADPDAPVEALYDWIYVGWLLDDHASVFQAARRLATGGGRAERDFFLKSLELRHESPEFRGAAGREQTSAKTPLNDEDLSLMLECFDALDDGQQGDVSAFHGGQVTYSSGGQAYINVGGTWMPLP
jgi:tetratricopeptide (TPR) repeat protein